MLSDLFPNLFNFTNVNLYDLIQIVAILIFAVAAISVGVNANKLNEQTTDSNRKIAELTQQFIEQNKKMKQAEMNIAVYKQMTDIYNFFIKDIFINNFFDKENEDLLRERCNEILFQSSFIFNQEVYEVVEKSINKIINAYASGIPSYTQEEYVQAMNNEAKVLEIKIYEAFINREDTAEDTKKSYENILKRIIFLSNMRDDIAKAFSYFKMNLGPEGFSSL
jgi:hypothetical protein